MKTIVNDEVLFTCSLKLNNSTLSLCKQSYSDGTCFYTLQDQKGNWKVEYGNRTIDGLIDQIKHEIKVEDEYKPVEMMNKYPQVKAAHEEVMRFKQEILSKLQEINQ